jgi:hypothetical protein
MKPIVPAREVTVKPYLHHLFHPPSTILISSSLSPYNSYTSRQSAKRHLPLRGGDLRGEHALLVRGARGGATLVQRQHLLHQRDHARVAGCVGGEVAWRSAAASAILSPLSVQHDGMKAGIGMIATYQVAVEQDSILVRMPANLFNREEIIRFLDYLEVESIRRRSQLTRTEAEQLADEIDQAGWRQLQDQRGGSTESK